MDEEQQPPKKQGIDPRDVSTRLLRVFGSQNPKELLKSFFEWGLTFITYDNLQQAIEKNIDPPTMIFNHYHLTHPLVSPIAQFIFKCFWEEIEYFVSSVPRMYKLFIRNPLNKELLDTKKGRKYLNRICRRSYEHLYNFTWGINIKT